jgi:hypothetical protein
MHELGLADDDWEDRIYYLRWHLGNEVGRRWWANYKDGSSNEFIQMVDEVLARRDYKDNWRLLESIMPAATDEQN